VKSGTETEAGGGREEGGRAVDAKRKARTPQKDVGNKTSDVDYTIIILSY
jgi:hypothetical protein